MAYIYRHIRLDKNQPFYIGIGSDESYRRAYNGCSRRNKIWNDIVNKTKYRVDIVLDNLTWEDAKEKEVELISLYGRIDTGTGMLANMTNGGDGTLGYIHSEFTKSKISNSHTGYVHTKDTRNKISKSKSGKLTGDKNPFYGKRHTDFAKRKMSELKSNGNSTSAKIVFDTYAGVYYSCVREAANAFGLNYGTLVNKLNGNKKNKTNLIYA